MKKLILFLALTFLFNINVSAASICASEEQIELNQKAANIKVNYEIETKREDLLDGTLTLNSTKVSIYNITKEFYVIVSNNINDEEMVFTSEDNVNGVITFNWDDLSTVTNFTIEVYTTDETGCVDEKYKTLYVTTPRYNSYYEREICAENPDFEHCQQFVSFKEISEEEFMEQLDKYLNKSTVANDKDDEKDIEDNKINYLNEYKWYIIGGIILVGAGIITAIYINRRKKQRELGL